MLARALRWVAAQGAFLLVLLVVIGAFCYLLAEPGRWGRGAGVVACAVLLAGLLRSALPTRRVGLLAVRSRPVDAVAYLLLGGLILAVDIRLHG